jgi:RND family efflux transporter MFP subunit
VTADRAAIDAAQVGLSYSRIHSPLSGRAGAIGVHPGTTVQPGAAALVTITQLDPIAVAFSLPQRNLNDALQTLRSGGGKVLAVLPEGRGQRSGTLEFVDSVVDANSGAVRMKAHFDNADEALWPGAFVTVRLALRTLKDAIVVPQAAVIQSSRGSVVYVVDDHDTVSLRPVELVHGFGTDAVVKGVAAGERVVLDGRQNLRPGVAVIERTHSQAGSHSSAIVAPQATAREAAASAAVKP